MQPESMQSMVIEAWVPANCVLTPSLVLHNLALQGIHPISEGMTITIDRGHYDCTDTRYAVIVVQTRAPLGPTHPDKWWQCSLFSRKAAPGMDATASYPHWLGNGYMRFGDTAPMCSYRYEAGHAKTWRRSEQPEPEQPEPEQPEPEQPEQSDAVSVDPVPIPQSSKNKNNNRIIQLQKKNFMLRTELDALKAELVAIKESINGDLGTVKADLVGLAQRHKEQEGATRRANQCMQDWANAQLLERVCILEQKQQQPQPQPQPQPQSCKKIKRIKRCMKRMSERLAFLENTNYNTHNTNANEPISWNPFDFKSIFDHYEEEEDNNGSNGSNDETECPALDLIEKSPCNNSNNDDNDDDMFEVLQIVPGSEFDFSLSISLPK